MTRGKLLDRIKVELAGGIAVRCVFGEETNFGLPDVKAATYLVNKFVFLYGFSDLGVTNFARTPYSTDFAVGANRPRKVEGTRTPRRVILAHRMHAHLALPSHKWIWRGPPPTLLSPSACTRTHTKVVETEAMDEMADWPTRLEDFRFDPVDPSDVTWHRCSGGTQSVCVVRM